MSQSEPPEVKDSTESGAEQRTLVATFREMATYGSVIAGLLCLLKVYAVARYSTTTTAALVAAAPGDVILGTLAIYVYPVMSGLTYAIGWSAFMHRRLVNYGSWPYIGLALLVCAILTPVRYHVMGVALVGVSFLVERLVGWAERSSGPGWSGQVLRAVKDRVLYVLCTGVLVTGFFVTLESPWGAAEVFVLKESGGFVDA